MSEFPPEDLLFNLGEKPPHDQSFFEKEIYTIGLRQSGQIEISVEQALQNLLLKQRPHDGDFSGVGDVYVAKEIASCGGVQAAILGAEVLVQMGKESSTPVGFNAPVTNGAESREKLTKPGVTMGIKPKDADPGSIYATGAHGNKRDYDAATERKLQTFDLTCIFVDKVQSEIESVADLMKSELDEPIPSGIVYLSIGGRSDHAEYLGSTQLMEDRGIPYIPIFSEEDLEGLFDRNHPNSLEKSEWKRLRITSQTTNDSDAAAKMAERIVSTIDKDPVLSGEIDTITFPYNVEDVCRTVMLRQKATRAMISEHNVENLVVIGSSNSKNTTTLVKVALSEATIVAKRPGFDPHELKLQRIILVNSHLQIPSDLCGSVGVVSGASSDQGNVDWILNTLDPENKRSQVGESDSERIGKRVFPLTVRGRNKEKQQELNRRIMDLAIERGIK
jgi:4-hydroxy-3-methylbut-2-enyl diphosphate reductase IspH